MPNVSRRLRRRSAVLSGSARRVDRYQARGAAARCDPARRARDRADGAGFVAAYGIAMAAQERFDGTGFPSGLKGDAIPLGARIVGVAEAYDELVSGDPGATMTPAAAMEMLQGERSHQFDPAVLQALSDIALEDIA